MCVCVCEHLSALLTTKHLCFACFTYSISVLGTQLDFNQYSPNGGRNEPLKMVHNGFEDLQIYFDLETFGNLLQLKPETETFLSQSIINFSLHALYF